ncbi:MAG: hypothetical protein U1E83_02900 [Methylotetracoccus sp.]
MKCLRPVVAAVLIVQGSSAYALCSTDKVFSTGDAVVELFVFRPLGLAGTIAGAAVFTAALPFTALASIAPPHDAVSRSSELLVNRIARWAFVRPFGDCRAMGYDDW